MTKERSKIKQGERSQAVKLNPLALQKSIRVKDIRSSRRLLARCCAVLQRQRLDRDEREGLRLLVYTLSTFAELHEAEVLENRIGALEEAQRKREKEAEKSTYHSGRSYGFDAERDATHEEGTAATS